MVTNIVKRYRKAMAAAVLAAAAAMPGTCPAKAEYIMQSLSINEGLSQNYAGSMLRDSRGYLWIGTRFGLNRYDFSRITQYYATDDKGSLPSDYIRNIFETPAGDVWVMCDDGTAVYHHKGDNFKEVRYERDKPLPLRSALVEGQSVLLGGAGNLYRYDCETGKLSRINTTGGSAIYYTGIHRLDDGNLLLTTRWDGAWLYKRTTGEITRYPGIEGKEVSAAHIDRLGRIWIAVQNSGLTCYDRSGKMLASFNTDNSDIGCDIVLDIQPGEATDELWLATDGAGVRSLRTETREIKRIAPDSGLSVAKIYKDGYGNLYAGTVDEGAQLFSKIAMRTRRDLPGDASGRFSPMSFLDTGGPSGRFYISTNGEGIWYIDKRTGTYHPVESTQGRKVTRIENYDDQNFIISTYGGSVNLLDRYTLALKPAPEPFLATAEAARKRGHGTDIWRLSNGLFAAINTDLNIIDTQKGICRTIGIPDRPNATHYMRPFYRDSNILMLFASDCVIRYDFHSGESKVIKSFPESTKVSCAQFDGSQHCYIGCNGGVTRLNIRTGESEQLPGYSTDKRHLNVTSMLLDGDQLWVGCSNSLFYTDLEKHRTTEFNAFDGVEPNEFLNRAVFAGPNYVAMGGSKGLLTINRQKFGEMMSYRSDVSFALSDLEVDGRSLIGDDTADGVVEIPNRYGSLELRFIDSERNPLRHKRYRFFINDGSKTSTIETESHELMLPMLASSRNYEISVASTLIDGAWTEPTRIATLKVAGPAWRSWWAILLYAFVLSGCAAVYVYHRRNIHREQLQLARQVQIKKERDFMQSMNNELRTPLTLIYAPLKLMLARMAEEDPDSPRLKELNDIYRNTKRMRDVMDITFMQWRAQTETGVPSAARPEQATDDTEPQLRKDDAQTDMSALTVMIAEEDHDMCTFLRQQLEPLFHKVAVFSSGSDAAAALKSGRIVPDLIITCDLPLASAVKSSERNGHIPVIFLSSVLGQQDKQEVYRLGIDSYISKPFDMAVLISRCGNLLRSRQVMRDRYKGRQPAIIGEELVRDNASEEFMLKVNQV
ncbi:MAG: response regulator, partial [Muribaculaceae bacterium]|nr:response regulator [Muribaculaceae bacterium]